MKSSYKNKKEFIFGSFVYSYILIKQDRKTLSLTVTPDLEIYVKTPYKVDDERIETFLKRKWFWLEKQLSFFGKYKRKKYKREYISGESLRYLGKQHKLIVKNSREDKVVLFRGILLVYSTKKITNSLYTKKLISDWYNIKSNLIFNERFKEVSKNFDYKDMPTLGFREMKLRWGSFMSKNKVLLNPKLIYTSKDCIDYVITHEMCHVKYKNHNKRFFDFLNTKYPNWEKTKEKLEITGSLIQ